MTAQSPDETRSHSMTISLHNFHHPERKIDQCNVSEEHPEKDKDKENQEAKRVVNRNAIQHQNTNADKNWRKPVQCLHTLCQ